MGRKNQGGREEKARGSRFASFFPIGVGAGVAVGVAIRNIGVGLAIGAALGTVAGLLLEQAEADEG